MDSEKTVYGILRLNDGRNIITTFPLSEAELAAFKKFPETFFGVYKEPTRKITDPVEMYLWFLKGYRTTPKEKLLEFMKGAVDFNQLAILPQDQLAKIYCERIVLNDILKPQAHRDQ
jgi:hypothetical protein